MRDEPAGGLDVDRNIHQEAPERSSESRRLPGVNLTPKAVETVRKMHGEGRLGAGSGLADLAWRRRMLGFQYSMNFDGRKDGDIVTDFDGLRSSSTRSRCRISPARRSTTSKDCTTRVSASTIRARVAPADAARRLAPEAISSARLPAARIGFRTRAISHP